MVVLEGQKRIEAGATVSVLDRDHAIFLRRGHYGMAATLSQETGAYRCAIFFDDAFLGEFAHQHSLLPDGRMAADPRPAGAARARVAATPREHRVGVALLHPRRREPPAHPSAETPGDPAEPPRRRPGVRARALSPAHRLRQAERPRPPRRGTLGRPVTIETLARTAGMSVSAFKREFRGAFAASPREWMTERRLDRARHLLARADRNVTDVSLEVGFESVSHFIHRFRRRFAVTPKQFQMSQSRQNQSHAR